MSDLLNLSFKNQSFCVSLKEKFPYSWASKNHLCDVLKVCFVQLSLWSWLCWLVSGFRVHSVLLVCLCVHIVFTVTLYWCLVPWRLTVFYSLASLLVWLLVVWCWESNLTKPSQLVGKCFTRDLHPWFLMISLWPFQNCSAFNHSLFKKKYIIGLQI